MARIRVSITVLIAVMLLSTVVLICVGFIPTVLVSLTSTKDAAALFNHDVILAVSDITLGALASVQVSAASASWMINAFPTVQFALQSLRPLLATHPATVGVRCVSSSGDLIELHREGPQVPLSSALFRLNTQPAGAACKTSRLLRGFGTPINTTTSTCLGDPREYMYYQMMSQISTPSLIPALFLGADRSTMVFPIGRTHFNLATTPPTPMFSCAFEYAYVEVFNSVARMTVGKHGKVFAFVNDGTMMAANFDFEPIQFQPDLTIKDPVMPVTNVFNLTHPWAVEALGAIGHQNVLAFPNPKASVDSDNYWITVDDASLGPGLALRIVVMASKDDFLADLIRTRNTVIAVVAVVFVFVMVVQVGVAVTLKRSVRALGDALTDLAAMDMGKTPPEVDEAGFSAISEVATLESRFAQLQVSMFSFSRYVPKELVSDMVANGEIAAVGMTNAYTSALFVDIEGFTSLCESIPLDDLSTIMELYYDVQCDIILENGGTVDKFIGDCIMCMWGVPTTIDNPNIRAVATGVRLRDSVSMTSLKDSLAEVGVSIRVRVGINSGEVMAGNMGCSTRLNYTVIGDAVNLAARLEALNKQFGTRVLISEGVNFHAKKNFVTRLLGCICVYGKEVAVKVYEVVGVKADKPVSPWKPLEEASPFLTAADSSDTLSVNTCESPHLASSDPSQKPANSGTSRWSTYGPRPSELSGSIGEEARQRALSVRQRRMDGVLLTREVLHKCRHSSYVANAKDEEFASKYSAAMALYIRGKFNDALAEVESIEPTDRNQHRTADLVDRIQSLIANPPPQGWTPVLQASK